MGQKSKWEYVKAIYKRYQKASLKLRTAILNEFCQVCHYNRKYAIRKLNGTQPEKSPGPFKRKRGFQYGSTALSILETVWKEADYPCGLRLKAIVQDWICNNVLVSETVNRKTKKTGLRVAKWLG